MQFLSAVDAAIKYAGIGWHVFPCKPNKHPYTPRGFHDASTELSDIYEWWRKWPDAGIGVACGASNIVVVDLDYDPDKDIDGPAFFARLEDEHGCDWCELVATTPRGGRHLIYRMPEERVRNRQNALPRSGIDIRGDGGYIVVPSPASPGRDWRTGDPLDAELTTPPGWVFETLMRRAANSTAQTNPAGPRSAAESPAVELPDGQVAEIREALRCIDPDERETWIRMGMALKSTGAREQAYGLWCEWSKQSSKFDPVVQRRQWDSLREFFWGGSEITLATLFYRARQDGYTGTGDGPVLSVTPEVTGSDADRHAVTPEVTTSDAGRHEIRQPPKHPFRREWCNVPGLVGDIAAWISENSPREQPALSLASAITTVGALLGRRVRSETDIRTNVYCLGIGNTGCGKDAGIRLPARLLARSGAKWAIGPGEWKSDTSVRSALYEHPSHAAYCDEFVKQLSQMAGPRAPHHLAGIRRVLLECYGAASGTLVGAAYADRKLNQQKDIESPNLCLYGTGVPGELFGSVGGSSAVADGLLNRFLVFWVDDDFPPRRKPGKAEPPEEMLDDVALLLKRTDLGGMSSMPESSPDPILIPFTEAAARMADEIAEEQDRRSRELREAGDPMSDMWQRYAQNAIKLALIRTASDDPDREIDCEDVAWGEQVVRWSIERTCAEAVDRLSDSEQEGRTKRVLRIIAEAGYEGIRQAALTRRTQWLRRAERNDILATLQDGGQVSGIKEDVKRPDGSVIPAVTWRKV